MPFILKYVIIYFPIVNIQIYLSPIQYYNIPSQCLLLGVIAHVYLYDNLAFELWAAVFEICFSNFVFRAVFGDTLLPKCVCRPWIDFVLVNN